MDTQWVLYLAAILLFGRLTASLFDWFGLSAVVGEIVAGVILFNYLGLLRTHEMEMLAEIGVILMMLMVGLETQIKHIMQVGGMAISVAIFGVLIPFGATYLLTLFMGDTYGLDKEPTRLFLSAVMVATSIAVTARIFLDLKATRSKLSRTILGAAVIDDILGLLILTIVTAVAAASSIGEQATPLSEKILHVCLFLFGIVPMLWFILPRLLRYTNRIKGEGSTFVMVLSLTFGVAYLAKLAGLEMIVGVFLLGAILADSEVHKMMLKDLKPLYWLLAPVFFVYVGMQIEIEKLGSSIGFGLLLCALAIITKLAGGIVGSLLAGGGVKRGLVIGLGMVPRGEVGLIIASIGAVTMIDGVPILGPELFASSALMCVVTILVVPLPLRYLARQWPELFTEESNAGDEGIDTTQLAESHKIP